MKIPTVMALLALCGAAQIHGQGQIRPEAVPPTPVAPTVRSVETTMAYAPGNVHLQGQFLNLVQEVRINGVAVPIVARTFSELEIQPAPQLPGFQELQLDYGYGTRADPIEFMPSLSGSMTPDHLIVTLNGDCEILSPGAYWLFYSFSCLSAPAVHPSRYYMGMLDLTQPSLSGMAVHGYTHGHPISFQFPNPIGIPGMPAQVFFQGVHVVNNNWSYTNLLTFE